jgi:hypothetical protein
VAPLSSTESFTTELAPADVLVRAQEWFAPYKGEVVGSDDGTIVVKSGSQMKMRLIGGAFIAGSSLPAITRVTLTANGPATDVTVTAEDAVGFGMKTGMKGKYLAWLGEITSGLRAALT